MLHGVTKCEFIFCLFFLQLKKKKAPSIGGGGRGRGSPAGAWGRKTVGGDEQVERAVETCLLLPPTGSTSPPLPGNGEERVRGAGRGAG